MQRKGQPPDTAALAASIGSALQRQLERDTGLRAAWIGLQRTSVLLTVRLEPLDGEPRVKVIVESRADSVPQWSSEDRELLRSLGIADDVDDEPQPHAPEPGRRRPR